VIGCLKSFALLLSAGLIAALLRPVASEYYIARSSGDPLANAVKASKITNEDARYHYLLGVLNQKRTDDIHLKEALESYRHSLERDPTRAFAWLALSKTYRDGGGTRWAEYAMRKAVWVDRANPKIIWEAGVFYLTQGEFQEAAPYFRKYIALIPLDYEKLYTMLHAVGAKPDYVLEQVLPPEYQSHDRYFKFLMAYKQSAELSEVWERRSLWKPENANYFAYCDFLIETGRVREARDVWTELMQRLHPGSMTRDAWNMIFNGDFEYPPQNGGFDWKTGNADGVEVFIDKDIKKSGWSSLAARFNGNTNPGIYVAQQVVAVKPKQHYRISAQIRTDRLTTRNGALVEVMGQNCPSLLVRSEVMTGTSDWRPLELEFTTPVDCSLIKVGIKRERSEKFDNKISGKVWLDEFEMREVNN
jgi:tetratricopeptide (TPR) repeat protein